MARLIENGDIVSGFLPIDLQAAQTGDYVTLKNHNHISIVLFKAAGTAGDDPTITVNQATAVAGTGAKALQFTDLWHKQATVLTATATWTHVTQTASETYTDATSAEDAAIWVVEFDASDLDSDGGFDCVSMNCSDVGSNAQLGCALYILTEPRYSLEGGIDSITD